MASFDLLNDPWLDFCTANGDVVRCSLKQALQMADSLCHVAEPSPVLAFGVYRFLFALTHWLSPLTTPDEWRVLWEQGSFPQSVVEDLERRGGGKFDLYAENRRFYQHLPQAENRRDSAGVLALELPSGTNINHFWHEYDENYALCLPCATKCLLSLPPFAPQGGSGHYSSINGNPPLLYHMPAGENLFQTILLNLPVAAYTDVWPEPVPHDTPAWERHTRLTQPQPSDPVGFLEGLTWQPRRPWLAEPNEGTCSLCGSQGLVCDKVVWRKHGDRKERPWVDPHLAQDAPNRPLKPKESKPAWALIRMKALLPAEPDTTPVVAPALAQVARLCASGQARGIQATTVMQIAFSAKQAVPENSSIQTYRVPSHVLSDLEASARLRQHIDDIEKAISSALGCFSKAQFADDPSTKILKKLRDRFARHLYSRIASKMAEAISQWPETPADQADKLRALREALLAEATPLISNFPIGRPAETHLLRPLLFQAIQKAINRRSVRR